MWLEKCDPRTDEETFKPLSLGDLETYLVLGREVFNKIPPSKIIYFEGMGVLLLPNCFVLGYTKYFFLFSGRVT